MVATMRNNGISPNGDSGAGKALTPIHGRIHCVATNDTSGGENELDQFAIDHFIGTLAEIALAVARRREALE